MGSGHSVNEGIGKEFYRKGNSLKRSRQFCRDVLGVFKKFVRIFRSLIRQTERELEMPAHPRKRAAYSTASNTELSEFAGPEGQKGTPGRGRDRKCHDRASLSRPLVLSLGPLTPP